MSAALKFTSRASGPAQIEGHLLRCEDSFVPPLSARVDIGEYARKLHEHALTFEAWDGDRLVGLVAMYIDAASNSAFVSNVSVEPTHAGAGTGSRLLADAIGFARRREVLRISLEVSPAAAGAIRLYARHGFLVAHRDHAVLRMQLDFHGNR